MFTSALFARMVPMDRVYKRTTRAPSSLAPPVEEAIQHITGFYALDERYGDRWDRSLIRQRFRSIEGRRSEFLFPTVR
jgi:hypothetical protein